MSDNDVHRIELRAKTVEELRAFLNGTDLDFGCRPAIRRRAGELVTEVYATLPQLDRARTSRSASGVSISVIENATRTGQARQAEVSSENRFSRASRGSGSPPPRGLGIKE